LPFVLGGVVQVPCSGMFAAESRYKGRKTPERVKAKSFIPEPFLQSHLKRRKLKILH